MEQIRLLVFTLCEIAARVLYRRICSTPSLPGSKPKVNCDVLPAEQRAPNSTSSPGAPVIKFNLLLGKVEKEQQWKKDQG
ncbi:hypothetical protein NFI96_021937 [Prochilodus magdalenae]|nr:hypothetical protein NFI96_021937 [Prochilodus magdalenae]